MSAAAHPKADNPAYLFNPETKRYVKADGMTARKIRSKMKRDDMLTHLRHHSINTALQNRHLMATDLSDAEVLAILKRVIDLKIDQGTKITDALPTTPKPKVGRHRTQSPPPAPKKAPKKKGRGRRYVVREPPPQSETEFDQTDAYSDSE